MPNRSRNPKSKKLDFYLSQDEYTQVLEIADESRESISMVVRGLVRQALKLQTKQAA